MKELLQKSWLMITGFLSSISVKGFADLHTQAMDAKQIALNATQDIVNTSTDHNLFWYFMVGVVGAIGGLLIKIMWGVIKRRFPSLNGIDQ